MTYLRVTVDVTDLRISEEEIVEYRRRRSVLETITPSPCFTPRLISCKSWRKKKTQIKNCVPLRIIECMRVSLI
jgi:hypothetical protein